MKRPIPSEIKALVGIEKLLAPLTPPAQDRLLTYFLSRVRDNDMPHTPDARAVRLLDDATPRGEAP